MGEKDTFEFGEIKVDLSSQYLNISHPSSLVFTSFDSVYLDSYKGGIINAGDFDTDDSLGFNPEYVKNYRRFLGSRYIHMGHLDITGAFTSPHADITLGYNLGLILKSHPLICDHDSLFNLLLYGTNTDMHSFFKDVYSDTDELLVRKLDINSANCILLSSNSLVEKINALFPSVQLYNISSVKEHTMFKF